METDALNLQDEQDEQDEQEWTLRLMDRMDRPCKTDALPKKVVYFLQNRDMVVFYQ